MTDWHSTYITADPAPIHLLSFCTLPNLWTRTKYFNFSTRAFLAENHALRLGGANSDPNCLTLGCKPIQCKMEAVNRNQQTENICKKQRQDPGTTEPDTQWLDWDTLSIKIIKWTWDKEQAWEATSTLVCFRLKTNRFLSVPFCLSD